MTTQAIANPAGGSGDRVTSAQGVGGAAGLGASLVSELGGSHTAGSWVGSDGQAVVAVTDTGTAPRCGGRGRRPRSCRTACGSCTRRRRPWRGSRVTGTAWSVDPSTNKVVVLADSTVSADDWSRLSGTAQRIGGEVTMERTASTFTTRVAGADAVFSEEARCSAGFNVTDGTNGFILTAGHCGPVNTTWFRDERGSTTLGTTIRSDFPGSDFSLVRYRDDTVDRSDVVDVGGGQSVRITGAADAAVGQQVFRSGSTTGLHSGTVTALDATVNYPEGAVSGLVQTNVCAEAGDSGGPLFSGGLALGVTSGGSGDCTSGGVTFFQPVTAALSSLGVRLAGQGSGTAASSAAQSGAATGAAPSTAGAAAAPTGIASSPAAQGVAGVTGGSDQAGGITTGAIDLKAAVPGIITAGAGLAAILVTRWSRPGQGVPGAGAGAVTWVRRSDGTPTVRFRFRTTRPVVTRADEVRNCVLASDTIL